MKSVPPKQQPTTSAQPTCEQMGNCPQPPPTCEQMGNCPQPPPPTTCEQRGDCPQPPPVTTCEQRGDCPPPVRPVDPVVPPTGTDVVVNPPVNQPAVPPKFEPAPITCPGGCGQKPEPKPILVCGEGGECPEIEPIAGSCKIRPVTSEKTITNKPKLDILFVLDTSPSFRFGPTKTRDDGELVKLANEMSSFIRSLPEGTDYRIGIILGNGPESPTFGKLFDAGRGDEAVLDSQKLSENDIKRILKAKMLAVPDDRAPGSRTLSDPQGEMLMLNLYTVVANQNAKQAVINAGLFRKNANLAIIAITDENDPCYSYPYDVSKYNTVNEELFAAGKVPVLKPYGNVLEMDRKEVATQRFCKTLEGKKLSHNDVLGQLKLLEQERKTNIIMNGIVYGSNAGLRAKVSDQDENEMGHGILDLIDAVKSGRNFDMAKVRRGQNVSFADALSQLGATTSTQMLYKTVWDCYGNIHPNAIDDETVEVAIIEAKPEEVQNWKESRTLDDRGQVIARYSAKCQGGRGCQHGDGGIVIERRSHQAGSYMRVTPADSQAFDRMMRDRNIRGAKYKITFHTRRGIDPRTGKPGTGTN